MISPRRFWMRAVSLKRPPNLLTISSLLSASIMLKLLEIGPWALKGSGGRS